MPSPAVVFENAALIAADKPSGVLTVPGRFGEADARSVLGRQLEAQFGRLWPVHRLDFEVSGLVIFARNADAHRVASLAFEERRVRKQYQALTEGSVEALPQAYTWESRLVRGKRRSFEAPHGKPARTRAQVVARHGAHLLWDLEPETGRPHQLRVHLARAGFPIVGDALYGAKAPYEPGGIALRAVRLTLLDAQDRRRLDAPELFQVAGLV